MKDIRNRSLLTFIAFAFVLVSLSSVNFVSADDSSSSTSSSEISKEKMFIKKNAKNEIKERLKNKKEKIKERIEKNKDDDNDDNDDEEDEEEVFEDKFDGKRSKINKIRFGTSTDELSTSTASTSPLKIKIAEKIRKQNAKFVEKLDKDVKRMENLYEKISSKVDKFEEKGVSVTEVRTLMGIARLKIDDAKSDIDEIVLQPISKISIVKIRSSMKSAQDSLVDVVKALKPGLNKQSTSSSVSSSGISSSSSSVI